MYIIDRRLNPGGKSLANRQRFLRRARAQVRRAVSDSSKERSIKDVEQEGEVSIPIDDVGEPTFRRSSSGGRKDHLLPGNKDFLEGDMIPRRADGGGAGMGGTLGSGQDDFRFVLSREEFLDLYLDDLELPDLLKRRFASIESQSLRRAGYSVAGSPSNLALVRTMRNSFSRRIALRRPKPSDIRRIEDLIATLESRGGDPDRLEELRNELAQLLRRRRRIPYLDPLDLRYRRFEPYPKFVAQAVMFCLMDVSGSVTEHMKDLAKRFFTLLYIFLKRRYRNVQIIFIRHTHQADEVDEDTFFNSTETGGTVVSTALEATARAVERRYGPEDWNIYVAQASDGDNAPSDSENTAALLRNTILPLCQYFAYLQVRRQESPGPESSAPYESELWRTYELVRGSGASIAMREVRHRRDIYPVFRELFQRKGEPVGPAEP
jgi:uncharacterized protein